MEHQVQTPLKNKLFAMLFGATPEHGDKLLTTP